MLVDISTGEQAGCVVSAYRNGVIDRVLPVKKKVRLEPDWVLQDPSDYLDILKKIPSLLKQSGVKADDVIGIGIDFTSCTILPVKSDGTPLCNISAFRDNPHPGKIVEHHAAQPEADRINQVAGKDEKFLKRYGGKMPDGSFPKRLKSSATRPKSTARRTNYGSSGLAGLAVDRNERRSSAAPDIRIVVKMMDSGQTFCVSIPV